MHLDTDKMIEDFFIISVRNIRNRGIRSWLTMIGIFIGIAAIVSLISLGEGLQNAINEQFEILGHNLIYIMPGGAFGPGFSSAKLTEHDLKIIKKVRGVDIASGMISKLAKIKFKDEVEYCFVSGIEPGDVQDILLEGTKIEIVRGQKRFKETDRYKAAVGYEYWTGNVFSDAVRVGDKIKINNKRFKVVAEVSRIGNSQDDKNIYIPLKTAKELFDVKDEYAMILVRVKKNYDTEKVVEEIKKNLRRDRGLERGEEDFRVLTLEQMKEAVGVVLDAAQAVVIGIAFISLFVGGIGIMNTMYTSVLERTREIGVMKAVGARNSDIMLLFLIESGIIGMVGGIVGCLMGSLLSKIVEYTVTSLLDQTLIRASITPELITFSLVFSFIIGCISGMMPAMQASRLKPVDALRYE